MQRRSATGDPDSPAQNARHHQLKEEKFNPAGRERARWPRFSGLQAVAEKAWRFTTGRLRTQFVFREVQHVGFGVRIRGHAPVIRNLGGTIEFGDHVFFDAPVTASFVDVEPGAILRIGPALNAAYIAGTNPPRAYGFGFGAAVGYNFIFSHFVPQLGVGGAVLDYGEGFVWGPHFRVGLGAAF